MPSPRPPNAQATDATTPKPPARLRHPHRHARQCAVTSAGVCVPHRTVEPAPTASFAKLGCRNGLALQDAGPLALHPWARFGPLLKNLFLFPLSFKLSLVIPEISSSLVNLSSKFGIPNSLS
jgi:hypothetical protein